MRGSAGERAGLQAGDVIIKMNGKSTESSGSFRNKVALNSPGADVNLTVIRNGKKSKITVRLDSMNGKRTSKSKNKQKEQSENQSRLGLELTKLTRTKARKLGYEGLKGLLITDVDKGSPADRAGLQKNQLILEVNFHN